MSVITNLIISTLAVIVIAYILPGVTVTGLISAFIVAIVLGILNILIRPLLIILTLPINILTLGLFTFVINAVIVLIASAIVPGFKVNGFWAALVFAIVLAVINSVFS
jgi:putative membrane protein